MLSEQIRDGQLKRGDKLPTESAIMDAHGVSRTVVREAISRLQAAGQVETRHGIGTFVLDTPSPSGFRIDPATIVTLRDVLAILELRISLEVESAGLAALRRSDEQLAGMRAALDALNESAAHAGDAVASDFQFHLQIALSTGNRYFTDIMTHLGTSIIPRTRLNSARLAQDDQQHYMKRLSREHEEIYEAIARQDSDAARAAMRLHFDQQSRAAAPCSRRSRGAAGLRVGHDLKRHISDGLVKIERDGEESFNYLVLGSGTFKFENVSFVNHAIKGDLLFFAVRHIELVFHGLHTPVLEGGVLLYLHAQTAVNTGPDTSPGQVWCLRRERCGAAFPARDPSRAAGEPGEGVAGPCQIYHRAPGAAGWRMVCCDRSDPTIARLHRPGPYHQRCDLGRPGVCGAGNDG